MLPAWIDTVEASQLPGLTRVARHLRRDLDAVTAGLSLQWSSGGTKGAVNRIKKIKRQLFARYVPPRSSNAYCMVVAELPG
ncbi:transposase [Streptomyces lomondensis]|uniref:Transposase IS204/IS1001/IS1096/IS1165 DDE domain-containing protein n=1 Tax=Streptomyces lomondensis TaxID=68229 RepID=A0ABQ2XRM7_9ACTN|nr:transposase [Streptomyces lomondensis]GGX29255.1 hypothetical protein GCM10010383_69850 [Streptomyces lomondensis]